MIQPRSLQQRHSIFLILPVALLMLTVGVTGFIYARNLILGQWQEAAILKLQRAAHRVDMQLGRVKELVGIFNQVSEDKDVSGHQFWAIEQIRSQPVVDHVYLTWTGGQAPADDRPGGQLQSTPSGTGRRGPRHAGQGMRMRRFRAGRIREVTAPRFDKISDHETVSLISDLIDEAGRAIGRLEVVLNFEMLIINVRESGWWQSNRAYLISDDGRILAATVSAKAETLSDSGIPLDRAIVEAVQAGSSGTLRGEGHPPDEVSGFYRLQEAPWSLVMIAPGREILAPIIRFRTYYFICGTAFILIIVLLIRLVTGRTVTAIKQVSEAAEKVAQGGYDQTLPVRTRDEVGELTHSFNTMVQQLKERLQMKEAMNLAKEVQQNLLPEEMPVVEGLDIFARSIYCDETGGDFYDFLAPDRRNSGRIGIAVGDVSGHGISSALLMASVRAFLRSRIAQAGSIGEIISDVNRLLAHDTRETCQFMTLFYAEIDAGAKHIHWIRAGHDPAMLYDPDSDGFAELKGSGMALGIDARYDYRPQKISGLRQGQVLLIGTDGLWETKNQSGEMFGKDRLESLIRQGAHLTSREMSSMILDALRLFHQSVKPEDDITLAVVKVVA